MSVTVLGATGALTVADVPDRAVRLIGTVEIFGAVGIVLLVLSLVVAVTRYAQL